MPARGTPKRGARQALEEVAKDFSAPPPRLRDES